MGSVELKYDFERVETNKKEGPDAMFEACLVEVADGGSQEIYDSMRELLELTCGYSVDAVDGIVAFMMRDIPLTGLPEYNVRIVKEAEPTPEQRTRLILRLAAFISTSSDASIDDDTCLSWSHQAIETVTLLNYDREPEVGIAQHRKAALHDYLIMLQGHIDRIIHFMGETEDEEEYRKYLTQATIISDLQTDIQDIVIAHEMAEEAEAAKEPTS